MTRIMLVDDDESVLNALKRLLTATPCKHRGTTYALEIETFASPKAALDRASLAVFDLFLVDYRMPEMDGVTFLRTVRETQPNAMRMILSGHADLETLVGAINEAKIHRFLSKPWNDQELVSAVAEAIGHRELLVERERLADQAKMAKGRRAETCRPEEFKPGITKTKRRPHGPVILDEGFHDPFGDEF